MDFFKNIFQEHPGYISREFSENMSQLFNEGSRVNFKIFSKIHLAKLIMDISNILSSSTFRLHQSWIF